MKSSVKNQNIDWDKFYANKGEAWGSTATEGARAAYELFKKRNFKKILDFGCG